MKHCVSGQKIGLLFPHLVTAPCQKARVQMSTNEQFMNPTKIVIGDLLYIQYIKLQKKKITKWN